MLTPELSTSLSKIEQRLGALENKALRDNVMMATLREDQDTEANRAMLDRLTVLGIRIPNIRRMKDQDRIQMMRQKVEELFDKLKEEGQVYEIIFVKHLNRQARNPDNTVLEVRLGDSKQAGDIRSKFIQKRTSSEWENYNITPAVRLSTRVRVELLQAIGRVIKADDETVSRTQCLQFVPRPVLKVYRKDSRGNEFHRIMTFIDCVIWVMENNLEKSLDLKKAYERAGSNFSGTLAQHFVLMS
jgi:hypothetical protein